MIALLAIACAVADTCGPTQILQIFPVETPAAYRVFARPADSASWLWSIDLPVEEVISEDDGSVARLAPGVNWPWALQRLVPLEGELTRVQYVVKPIDAQGREGAPSNVIELCMPQTWRGGPYR